MALEETFRQFCAFGDKDSTLMMDGAKFAKMCRDCKLLDKKLTAIDVDIIFAKAKPKTERKLNLRQFQEAVEMLAEKKYPGDPHSLDKIASKLSSGPTTHPDATKVAQDRLLERMTDTSKYTGAHKLRFDESGKGKGLEGRDSVAKGPGHIPALVSSQPSYVTGNLIGLDAVDSARAHPSPSSKTTAAKSSPRVQAKTGSSPVVKTTAAKSSQGKAGGSPVVKSSTKAKSSVATSSPKSTSKPKPKGGRLADTSSYTGLHKHRFDEAGRGKGLQGRDAPAKGAAMTPSPASNLAPYVSGYKHENTYRK